MTENIKIVAQEYQKAGLRTLPVKNKIAHLNTGADKWKGITDLNLYKDEIAIICGEIECMDFDNHSGDAKEVLQQFLELVKPLNDKYNFPIEKTINGGFHLVYKCKQIEGSRKLAQRLLNGNPDTFIETRGEKSYFVCDPSPGYELINGSLLNIPVISPDERQVLIETALSFNEYVKPETISTGLNGTNEKPGDLYNERPEAISEAKDLLKYSGWKEFNSFQWQRPDKKEGISATFGKVAPNVFFNFSSNGHPFEPLKAYKPFQILALLKFNGDFKEAAIYLIDRYKIETHPEPTKTGIIKQKSENIDLLEKIDHLIQECKYTINSEFEPPIPIIKIKDKIAGTLGNFSMITGKAKSRKTFLITLILGFISKNYNSITAFIKAEFPEGRKNIVIFDTEQAGFHALKVIQRIKELGGDTDRITGYKLRPFQPSQRLEIIERVIETNYNTTALFIIDGIRDIAQKGINDEETATMITSKLLEWTDKYQIHIITVLHQNKADKNPRGHLGTEAQNKAETVLSTEKDEQNQDITIVKCEQARNEEFQEFAFQINFNGLPELLEEWSQKTNQKQGNILLELPPETHHEILNKIFKTNPKPRIAELRRQFKIVFEQYGHSIGDNKAGDFIQWYRNKGYIKKEGKDNSPTSFYELV
jgi:hypothetical protein